MLRLLLYLTLMLTSVSAQPLETFTAADGTTFRYALLLPGDFDPAESYPVLLALPPGHQSLEMVEAGLSYWGGGERRGWVVVSPEAPGGRLFFRGSSAYVPELLDDLAKTVKFEGGKVHVAGISNGGRSAFRVALDYPERVHSLLAVPGFPDDEGLEPLRTIPVAMYAGERDSFWVEEMRKTETALSALGAEVSATVVPGEGHVIQSLTTNILFDVLDEFR